MGKSFQDHVRTILIPNRRDNQNIYFLIYPVKLFMIKRSHKLNISAIWRCTESIKIGELSRITIQLKLNQRCSRVCLHFGTRNKLRISFEEHMHTLMRSNLANITYPQFG